jgi:DNA invertase Pin-like site-specific DNA recombinase
VIVIFGQGKGANALWSSVQERRWDEYDDVTAISRLEELMRLVHSGKVSIVLMSSLKGLASNVPELVAVIRSFIERGIRLIVPNFKVDTSKMPKKEMIAFLDNLGEFHHTVAVENIIEGLARARERGVRLGRPHSVNPHHDQVVALREQGLSGYKIAERLRVPSSTVYKIIGTLRSH